MKGDALRVGVVFGAVFAVATSTLAAAQITVGPYEFSSEDHFAQTATKYGDIPSYPLGTTLSAQEAVTGYSPNRWLFHAGLVCNVHVCNPTPEVVEMGFGNPLPREGPGSDLVFFNATTPISSKWPIEVRPLGEEYLAIQIWPITRQVPGYGISLHGIGAIEVDLAAYGLPPGTKIDSVRVVGDCDRLVFPLQTIDPIMGASIDRSCILDSDCGGTECVEAFCVEGQCDYEARLPGTRCESGGLCGPQLWPVCVECIDDSQCAEPTPFCHPKTQTCSDCIEDEDCATGFCAGPEESDSGDAPYRCAECLSNRDCVEIERPVCNRTREVCVGCVNDYGCNDSDECTADACGDDGQCIHEPMDGCASDGGSSSEGDASTDNPNPGPTDAATRPAEGGPSGDAAADPQSGGCSCRTMNGPPATGILLLSMVGLGWLRRTARRRRTLLASRRS